MSSPVIRHGHLRAVQRTYNRHGDRLDEALIPKILNALPMDLTGLEKIGMVKKQTKTWLLTNLRQDE